MTELDQLIGDAEMQYHRRSHAARHTGTGKILRRCIKQLRQERSEKEVLAKFAIDYPASGPLHAAVIVLMRDYFPKQNAHMQAPASCGAVETQQKS